MDLSPTARCLNLRTVDFGGWVTVVCGGDVMTRVSAFLASILQMPEPPPLPVITTKNVSGHGRMFPGEEGEQQCSQLRPTNLYLPKN